MSSALSNVTSPTLFPTYENLALTFQDVGEAVEPYKFTLITGAYPADGTARVNGVSLTESTGNTGEKYFTLCRGEIAVVQLAASETIAYGAPLSAADDASGNARLGVEGTDFIAGVSLDISDGSGTAQDPHYVRVLLSV